MLDIDLHSGVFGGTVYEPMTDLFSLFSKLVKPDGTILIPGLDALVLPLTEEEKSRYVSRMDLWLGFDLILLIFRLRSMSLYKILNQLLVLQSRFRLIKLRC